MSDHICVVSKPFIWRPRARRVSCRYRSHIRKIGLVVRALDFWARYDGKNAISDFFKYREY